MPLGLPDKAVHDLHGVQRNFEFLAGILHTGRGSPENVVAAKPGALYLNEDANVPGTTLYVKESGTGKAGWTAK